MKLTNLHKTIIKRLVRVLFQFDNFKIIDNYLDRFTKLRKTNGLPYTIKYMKAVRLHITRYVCGRPLFSNTAGVGVDSSGWPVRYRYLKFLTKSLTGKRILFTLLSFTRAVKPTGKELEKVKPDFSSITGKYTGKQYTIPAWFIKDWIKRNQLSLDKPNYQQSDHYVSMKSSPNGPATYSSRWSILTLSYPQLQCIFNLVGSYHETISSWYKTAWENSFKSEGKKEWEMINGKLSIVKDPELKMRVIAMVDYQTQFTLRPIHEGLLKLLRKLPCDRTFTQDPLNDWWPSEDNFHSLDLSSATDRFPIQLQEKLISYIYKDGKFAQSWAILLTERAYYHQGKPYTYSVGQPMGAYSSWAAFTLTHHLVVAWCAFLAHRIHFNQYIILGDDIVIKDDKVANNYRKIMARLGVEISSAKTHVSKDTYEFAKRWFQGGVEISGVPLKGILSQWKNMGVVYDTIFNYCRRTLVQPIPMMDLMVELYRGMKLRNRIWSRSTIHKALYDFHYAMRFTHGLCTYDELRSYICTKVPDDLVVPPANVILHWMKQLLSEGLVGEASKVTREVLMANERLENKLKTINDDLNLFGDYPLVHGYVNHLRSMKEKIKDYKDGKITLLDSALSLRIEKVDRIVAMNRMKSTSLTQLAKLWKTSFSTLFEDHDEWWEMAHPHLMEEGLLQLNPWESALDTNIQFTLNKFKPMMEKSIGKEPEPTAWGSLSWDDFKM
jgi:hypothetical protein